MKIFKCLCLTLTFFAFGVEAFSYRSCFGFPAKWKDNRTTMHLNTVSFRVGGTWDRQFQEVMNAWNDVKGSNFKFILGRDRDDSVSNRNRKNEVAFVSEGKNGYVAITSRRYSCPPRGNVGKITEMDIYFNVDKQFNTRNFLGTYDDIYKGYNFRIVALHELGHALGLEHQDNRVATMNTLYYSGGPNGHYSKVEPHADDRRGVRYLYPDSSYGRDISASRYKYYRNGTIRGKVYNSRGRETRYLTRGSKYSLDYVIQNLGTVSESPRVNFYISKNDYISKYDKYVGSTSWRMPPGSTAQSRKTFTVPSNLTPGKYYIGFVVDPNKAIPEDSETNNFVSLFDSITIQ
ncbi:MAG: matrixin family metalloprotease [Pseudomonadota bacterium]